MSKQINISSWVAKAKSNPGKYSLRQATEILINAIGQTKFLKGNMFLKGGALMALAHQSQRMTGDVDFSWLEPFHKDAFRDIGEIIRESLDQSLSKAGVKLGYVDLRCKVQSITKNPNHWKKDPSFPALKLTIGYAKVGSSQEKLLGSNCSQVLEVDISFNEEINNCQELVLEDGHTTINAYSPIEIISEKLRALIQQVHRGRNRRQDVYDINFLLGQFCYDEEEKKLILETMISKAKSRKIYPNINSLSDSGVKEASEKEWHTMKLELSDDVPDFDECYKNVEEFYKSLPWESAA
jgi:predicted nucleotidyltransferase component of viral defense system